jgi:hypothetical protein
MAFLESALLVLPETKRSMTISLPTEAILSPLEGSRSLGTKSRPHQCTQAKAGLT